MENFALLLDSDGCVADCMSHWVRTYNDRYNDNLSVEEFAETWDGIVDAVKPECGEKVYDLIKEKGFFEALEPIEGAIEGVDWVLDKGINVLVVTAFSANPNIAYGKVAWYQKYFPDLVEQERLILCHNKERVIGDMLVDDAEKNLKKWHRAMTNIGKDVHPICFAAPHNGAAGAEPYIRARVENWCELKGYIESFIL